VDLFAGLSEIYKEYETRIETIGSIDYFVIANPFWDENIRISYEETDGIIFFFSSHHAHFDRFDGVDMAESVDSLIEHVNGFLNRKIVAVEFFVEGTDVGGGSRYLEDIDMSSGESLLKSFAGDNVFFFESVYSSAKGLASRCSIHGWNSADNKDVDFTL